MVQRRTATAAATGYRYRYGYCYCYCCCCCCYCYCYCCCYCYCSSSYPYSYCYYPLPLPLLLPLPLSLPLPLPLPLLEMILVSSHHSRHSITLLSSGTHVRISRYNRQFSSLWVTVCLNTAVYSSSCLSTLSNVVHSHTQCISIASSIVDLL